MDPLKVNSTVHREGMGYRFISKQTDHSPNYLSCFRVFEGKNVAPGAIEDPARLLLVRKCHFEDRQWVRRPTDVAFTSNTRQVLSGAALFTDGPLVVGGMHLISASRALTSFQWCINAMVRRHLDTDPGQRSGSAV